MKKIVLLSLLSLCMFAGCKNNEMKEAEIWADALLTEYGIDLKFHPSTDFVQLKSEYTANPEVWKASLEYLAGQCKDLDAIELGTFPIMEKRCYASQTEYIPKAGTKFEGHRKYIDIQVTQGPVMWGIVNVDNPKLELLDEYKPEKDNIFYTCPEPTVYEQGADPCVFVFFPSDLHNPSYAVEGATYDTPLKKIVIKVEVAAK